MRVTLRALPTNNVRTPSQQLRAPRRRHSTLDKSHMSEADEVARLKAELASLQQETAALEKKPKKKRKKEKKKRKSTEDDEAAKLRAELEAVDAETAALTGAPPPEKKRKKDKKAKKTKADAPAAPADADAPPARRAYVGGLPFDATEESVANYFETLCGDLEKVEIQGFEDNPERCCGIAYVTFVEPDSLDRALTLDGESFKGDGRTMKIRRDRTGNKPRRPPPPRIAGSLTVYVGNMPWAASKEEVETMLTVMRAVLYRRCATTRTPRRGSSGVSSTPN